MEFVQLGVTPPDEGFSPVREAFVAADDFKFGQLLYGSADLDPLTQMFLVNVDFDGLERALEARPKIIEYDVEPVEGDYCYIYTVSRATPLFREFHEAVTRDSLVATLPVELFPDGSFRLDVIGRSEDLQSGIESLPKDLDVDVERIGEYDRDNNLVTAALTDRQQEAIWAGIETGYYDVPRRATHRDIAAVLDCAPSTASEHLQKAETKVINAVFGPLSDSVRDSGR